MTNNAHIPSRDRLVPVLLPLLLLAGPGVVAAPHVEVTPRPAERRVDVRIDGRPFTAYIWPERLAKPVLFPIRTAAGTPITRGFPLDPRPGERVDHPHHVGLWLNYGDVNGVDFWNNSEALSPEQAARMGSIRHRAILDAEGGTDQGTLVVRSEWVMPDGSTALEESTTFVFRGADEWRSIDRVTRLAAPRRGGRVLLPDNKEGLLGLRVTRALEAPSDEPVVLTDARGEPGTSATANRSGATGEYHSSEGLEGEEVWGTRGRWMALAGHAEDEEVVLLILDHPDNPGHPTYWHARGYGLFAANPLGQKVFSRGREVLGLALEPGESMVLRHRLLLLSGPFSAERAESAWKAFVARPPGQGSVR